MSAFDHIGNTVCSEMAAIWLRWQVRRTLEEQVGRPLSDGEFIETTAALPAARLKGGQ